MVAVRNGHNLPLPSELLQEATVSCAVQEMPMTADWVLVKNETRDVSRKRDKTWPRTNKQIKITVMEVTAPGRRRAPSRGAVLCLSGEAEVTEVTEVI